MHTGMPAVVMGGPEQHSHEQTGLSTGTVADDDELSTDLRHGVF